MTSDKLIEEMLNKGKAKEEPEAGEKKEEPKMVTMTQEDLDRIISDRLSKAEAKHQKEMETLSESHKKELERATMSAEERTKAEADDALKTALKERDDAQRALSLSKAEAEFVKAGFPAEMASMMADGGDTTKMIEALTKASTDKANALYAERVASGAPPAPNGSEQSERDKIREAMGLR